MINIGASIFCATRSDPIHDATQGTLHLRSHRFAFDLWACTFLPLNRSTSAIAATPATSLPSAALRFATLWIVKRSGRVKVEVSDSGKTSMAAGGAMA